MKLSEAQGNYLNWLRVARNPSAHTIRAYGSDLTQLAKHLGPSTPVEAISGPALLGFLTQQVDGGLNPNTIRRRACAIRGLLGWLHEEGLVSSNPWDGMRVNLRKARTLPRPVPLLVVRQLLTHLSHAAGVCSNQIPLPALQLPHESTCK